MDFSEFIEEWKPFPKDKVDKQIAKKKEQGKNPRPAGQKADVDGFKYLVEYENAHQNNGDHHGPSHKDDYLAAMNQLDEFRLIKEGTEIEIIENEDAIKSIKADVKLRTDELNMVLKKVEKLK